MRAQVLIFTAFVLMSTTAFAAALSPACEPVVAAMEKTLQTDHAMTTVSGAQTIQGITVDGVTYLQAGGAWTKSPISVKEMIDRSRENLTSAREYACKPMPDSSVGGVAVANYATHTVTEDVVVDGTVAIDKRTGLAVRVENGIKISGGRGNHYATQYTYGGIKPPM
jgi:hypothetical protein